MFTDTPGTHPPPGRPPRLRFRLLRWLASRLERRPIDVDGRPYMDRYYLAGPMPPRCAAYWPEDNRPRERLRWLPRTWYLHKLVTPDAERDLHDHPWDGRGRVLASAYVEHTAAGVVVRCEGDKTHVTPGGYHRIARLIASHGDPEGEVWTLLRVGPVVNRWGYLVDGEHVRHEDYHAAPVRRVRSHAGEAAL